MLLLIEKIILVLQVTLIFKVLIKMTSNHNKRKMELEATLYESQKKQHQKNTNLTRKVKLVFGN